MVLPEFNDNGLMPTGVHASEMLALYERCVAPFGKSTRETLWQGLQRYQAALQHLGIHATQWVNGSFVDLTRHDPEDIDLVNFVMADVLERVPEKEMDRVADLLAGDRSTVAMYGCQTNLVVVYPVGHKMTTQVEARLRKWYDLFSTARDYTDPSKPVAPVRGRKGFVELFIGDPNLCPILRHVF
jgi:hypothetical protein